MVVNCYEPRAIDLIKNATIPMQAFPILGPFVVSPFLMVVHAIQGIIGAIFSLFYAIAAWIKNDGDLKESAKTIAEGSLLSFKVAGISLLNIVTLGIFAYYMNK